MNEDAHARWGTIRPGIDVTRETTLNRAEEAPRIMDVNEALRALASATRIANPPNPAPRRLLRLEIKYSNPPSFFPKG